MAAGAWTTGAGWGDVLDATALRAFQYAVATEVKNKTFVGHPVIQDILARDAGYGNMAGAVASRIGLLAGGDDTMAATAVGSAASATNFSATAVDITPARQQHVASVGDWGVQSLTEITNINEAINLMTVLVTKGTTAWTNRYTALLLALISSLSLTAGTTGTDLTWYKLFAGIVAARDRGNVGRGLIVLNSTALLKLATDLTSVSNAYALSNIARKIVESSMDGGTVAADINGCDLMMLSSLPTSGGDTYGALLFPGVWASKHVAVPFPPGAHEVYNVGVHRCEAVRGAGTDLNSYSFTAHVGVAEADDNRGTRIIWAT